MAKDDRTLFDLSDDEYEDLEKNPEKWGRVIDNSIEDGWNMMFPDQDSYADPDSFDND